MTFIDHKLWCATDCTQYRQVSVVLDRSAQLVFLAWSGHPVEDDPTNPYIRVELGIARQQRRHPAGDASDIQYQYHRQVQQSGQCGVTVRALYIQPIVQTLVAFDQYDVSIMLVRLETRLDLVFTHGEKIKVPTRPCARPSQPQWINIVRPFLEGRYAQPTTPVRRTQTNTHQGLA